MDEALETLEAEGAEVGDEDLPLAFEDFDGDEGAEHDNEGVEEGWHNFAEVEVDEALQGEAPTWEAPTWEAALHSTHPLTLGRGRGRVTRESEEHQDTKGASLMCQVKTYLDTSLTQS